MRKTQPAKPSIQQLLKNSDLIQFEITTHHDNIDQATYRPNNMQKCCKFPCKR